MEIKLNVSPEDIVNIWHDLYGSTPLRSEPFLRRELLASCMNRVDQLQNELEVFETIFGEWESDSKPNIELDKELLGEN